MFPKSIPLLLSIVFWAPLACYAQVQPFHVVIDPGHGGEDEGTVYDNGRYRITEKAVTLVLARQIAAKLGSKGYVVTLTRNRDQELTLPFRTALANHLKADLFISIHMNSIHGSGSRDAEGIETYILNNTTDASSKRLAHLENTLIPNTLISTPEDTDIALILKDLRLDGNLYESKRLACNVQNSIVNATSDRLSSSRRNRGVKQALFHVLLGADMPSILVEAGFLSNTKDRSTILSNQGQQAISQAISTAIENFRDEKKIKNHDLISKCKTH